MAAPSFKERRPRARLPWFAAGVAAAALALGLTPRGLHAQRFRGRVADFMVDVPLDLIYSIVVLTPTDGSMVYPAGAVLLHTAGWLR